MPSTLRQATIPIDHVYAELVAFPLASESAFRLGLDEICPAQATNHDTLWQGFEAEAARSLLAFTPEELACLRDRVWYGAPSQTPIPMHQYLRRQARGLLRANGRVAEPRPLNDATEAETFLPVDWEGEEGAAAARRRWRWVTFALPPDLLLAALPDAPPAIRLDALSPTLRGLLRDSGFAETHLHVGAALDFGQLWASLQYALVQDGLAPEAFASPGAAFDSGRLFGPWLLRAALARCLLGGFVHSGCHRHPNFTQYLDQEYFPRISNRYGVGTLAVVVRAMTELVQGSFSARSPNWDELHLAYRDVYRELTLPADALNRLDRLDELGRIDPIGGLLNWQPTDPELPEAHWFRAVLARVELGGDELLARLFWQVIRIRCLYFRHVSQRPQTAGIHWFIRFFGRLRAGKAWFAHAGRIVQAAFRLQGHGEGLRSLEVRTAPEDTWDQTDELLARLDSGVQPGPEFGVVLHFNKDRGDKTREGSPASHGRGSHSDPARNPTGYRFAVYFDGAVKKADGWAQAIRHRPACLRTLRGIDVCSDERAIPNWVFVPLFNRVIQAAQEVAGTPREGPPPLRKTVHVGEDFVHPLTGLRLVAEAVRYFGLRAGDRLGHALALGVDFLDWASRSGRVALRVEDRLFDLVWEWAWCSTRRTIAPNRLPFLAWEIRRLSSRVFGQAVTPEALNQLVLDLHNWKELEAVGFPNGVEARPRAFWTEGNFSRTWLLHQYLTDAQTFLRGQETEWFLVADEGELLAGLQTEVRREVGQRGVVVEVNPSSNLLIGEFGDLRRHPFWRLAAPPGFTADAPPLVVCLGSDDPITFVSDIRQEYQLVYDALLAAGNSAAETLRWVDHLRATSLAVRFTLPESARRAE